MTLLLPTPKHTVQRWPREEERWSIYRAYILLGEMDNKKLLHNMCQVGISTLKNGGLENKGTFVYICEHLCVPACVCANVHLCVSVSRLSNKVTWESNPERIKRIKFKISLLGSGKRVASLDSAHHRNSHFTNIQKILLQNTWMLLLFRVWRLVLEQYN